MRTRFPATQPCLPGPFMPAQYIWGYAAGLGAYCMAALVALHFLGDLWIFHMALISKGITTWEYIQVRADSTSSDLAKPP